MTETSASMSFGVLALGAVLVLSATPAWGWDDEGHMMVAAVAWDHLGDASRSRVTALLKLNPDYPIWTVDTTLKERDQIAFIRAATWPDAIKSEADYENDGNRPEGPDAGRNIGYADHLQHRYWHFIDLPFSTDGAAVPPPATPNVQTQIHTFTAAIGSHDVSDDIKSYDLVWLEHLVGDAHQPLHATSRFSSSLPLGDRGGNLVALRQTLPRRTSFLLGRYSRDEQNPGSSAGRSRETAGAVAGRSCHRR